jgi:hypothetical protein
MKREAGVTGHTIQREELGGLAYIGTGRIQSPEGRKITQLYVVAHECGHIFLHNSGSGYWLPGHIKELEAESYAHQAFREHGMTLPRRITDWGRRYVGSWVEKDRAQGIPIDPRAEAYANGHRSPYEPLRMVPSTWQAFRPARPPASSMPAPAVPSSPMDTAPADRRGSPLREEACAVGRLTGLSLIYGFMAFQLGHFLLYLLSGASLMDLFPESFAPNRAAKGVVLDLAGACCALLIANVAVLCRTLVRH